MVRREISYILLSDENCDDEFVVRNLSYSDWRSFRDDVIRLSPLRIDIGAIYDGDVKNNKDKVDGLSIAPVEREYVIDIDLTDYDNIRTCCEGKTLCEKCWTYVRAAHKVLSHILSASFGFRHILWVFSGRRGIHAWVCDKEARSMSKKVRQSVTNFLNFTITNDKTDHLVKHQLIRKAKDYGLLKQTYGILKEYKRFLFDEQKILERPNIYQKVKDVAEKYLKRHLTVEEKHKLDDKHTKGSEKFVYLATLVGASDEGDTRAIQFKMELILGYLYPKLDSHVSAQVNHLLKAPFNVHHASMNISLPIVDINAFSIKNALSVHDVLRVQNETGKNPIQPYIDFFKEFCANCEESNK